MQNSLNRPRLHLGEVRSSSVGRSRAVVVAAIAAVIVVALVIFLLVRGGGDDGTVGQADVIENDAEPDGSVRIVQRPSLALTATIDGVSITDGVDISFGTPTEMEVTVTNNGNLTMNDIAVSVAATAGDSTDEVDSCELPEMGPDDSASCTVTFTATGDTDVVTTSLEGFGPQRQEVTRELNLNLN